MPFNPDGTYNFDLGLPGLPGNQSQAYPQSPVVNAMQPVVPGQPGAGVIDKKDTTGFNPYIQGIGAATGVANAYLGFENLKLGKKQFGFAKETFNRNLANQAQLTNEALRSRQRSRILGEGLVERGPGLEEDLSSYVKQHGVSGAPV